MNNSSFPQPSAGPLHSRAHARPQPLTFASDIHTRYYEAGGSHDPAPLDMLGVDGVGSTSAFHTPGFGSFAGPYTGPPSGAAVTTVAVPRGVGNLAPTPTSERPHRQQQPMRSKKHHPQAQGLGNQESSASTVSTNPALPSLSQFDTLPPSPAGSRTGTEGTGNGSADLARTDSGNGATALVPARSGQLPVDIVENPPELDVWRQRLFDLKEPIILTEEEYNTYFPWVDNVYSHRSTQLYKRKNFVTRYFDCRMKGRPSGTPKSEDPTKRKRKRTARERDLCDVKVKITDYPAGATAELRLAGHGIGLDSKALDDALERIRDGAFRVIQRINSGGTNGGGGSDGQPARHKHDLRRSDEIKKSTALRVLAEREREAKRGQKPSPWRPRGEAAVTAKKRANDAGIRFYSACFCPFSQRVWIALEAKGLEYQYCEVYPLRKPKPTPLLEANPRGLVPAIWQEGWACAESSVILEYLEDFNGTASLYPTHPKLKANCRLWIDFINARIVPSFFSVLTATDDDAQKRATEKLQRHTSELVEAADEKGPYFLSDHICLVDVHLAPFALRLSRLAPFRDLAPPTTTTPPERWERWLEALEKNPHVRATTSADSLYVQSVEDLCKGFQGMVE